MAGGDALEPKASQFGIVAQKASVGFLHSLPHWACTRLLLPLAAAASGLSRTYP